MKTTFERLISMKHRITAQENPITAKRFARCVQKLRLCRLQLIAVENRNNGNTEKAERISRVIAMYNHRENRCMGYSVPDKRPTVKAYKPLADHRQPVISAMKFDTSENVYRLARWAVNAKIKGARLRGLTDNNNIYIRNFSDMMQTATLAIMEAYKEETTHPDICIDCAEFSYFYEFTYTDKELVNLAMKACGRLEKRIFTRSTKEPTSPDMISDKLYNSRMEERLTTADSVKTIYRDIVDLIMGLDLTPKAKQAFLDHFKNGELTPMQQRILREKALKAGLIKMQVVDGLDGKPLTHVYINY